MIGHTVVAGLWRLPSRVALLFVRATSRQVQRHHSVNGKRNGPLGTSSSRVLSVGVGVGASSGAVSRPGTIPTPNPSDVMHQLRHSQSQGLLGQGGGLDWTGVSSCAEVESTGVI